MWRQNAEVKMKVLGLHPIWLYRKATTLNGVQTSTTSGKLKMPMAIRLQESDLVVLGYVHSHEIPEKTHPLLLSQACQAKLGMTKRVREGSITLDDYDSQSMEVARQEGTGLCMIRIDHLIHDGYVCNPLLDDRVTDLGAELDCNNVARGPDQPCSSDCYTHAMVNYSRRKLLRSVLQADTRILSGLLGRRSAVTKFGDRAMNWLQWQTMTSFSTVLRTTTLESETVAQYG